MKFQLLPSTFDEGGVASVRQHLTCFVVDDCVAFDAGSLAMAASPLQRRQIRDIVLTHAHLDHIAGLPLFIDDLFSTLTGPICIHAESEVIEILERDIFNWSVYPRFSELSNDNGSVLAYRPFKAGDEFEVRHLRVRPIAVNHKVSSNGFIVSNGVTTLAMTGDTAETDEFWRVANSIPNLSALLIECAFPNELEELANLSHHMTPQRLMRELTKFEKTDCPVYAINIKPMYREQVLEQLGENGTRPLEILNVGQVYEW